MAQTIELKGTVYPDVPSVELPTSDGGIASFVDTSDATMVDGGSLLEGVTAYSQGTKISGTIISKNNSDVTVNADTVSVPSGYYEDPVEKSIAAGSVSVPATTITKNPTITVDNSTGLITATYSGSKSITPTVEPGYILTGTSGTVSTTGTATKQMTAGGASVDATTITKNPTITVDNSTGLITATYSGSKSITPTVTSGFITSGASGTAGTVSTTGTATKQMTIGSASVADTTITKNPTITVDSSTGLITATYSGSKSITPAVTTGFITSGTSGTAGTVSTTGTATKQLTVQAAQTITPGTSAQTIAAGTYLTGRQLIQGSTYLKAANIKEGVSIFGVTGTYNPTSAYAYIIVEFIAGSTITCTNTKDSIDLSSTMKLFLVTDNKTSCTITATKDNQIGTRTVSITAGESYYVLVSYYTYLYHLGTNSVSWTAANLPYSQNGNSQAPSFSNNTDNKRIYISRTAGANYGGYYRTSSVVNLTNYQSLKVSISAKGIQGVNHIVDIVVLKSAATWWSSTNNTSNVLARASVLPSTTTVGQETAKTTYTLNVSTISQSAYIGIGIYAGSPVPTEVEAVLYDCYLIPS